MLEGEIQDKEDEGKIRERASERTQRAEQEWVESVTRGGAGRAECL